MKLCNQYLTSVCQIKARVWKHNWPKHWLFDYWPVPDQVRRHFSEGKTEFKGYVIKDASYSYVIVMSLE